MSSTSVRLVLTAVGLAACLLAVLDTQPNGLVAAGKKGSDIIFANGRFILKGSKKDGTVIIDDSHKHHSSPPTHHNNHYYNHYVPHFIQQLMHYFYKTHDHNHHDHHPHKHHKHHNHHHDHDDHDDHDWDYDHHHGHESHDHHKEEESSIQVDGKDGTVNITYGGGEFLVI